MSPALRAILEQWRAPLEARLAARLPHSALPGAARLDEAIAYAVFPGGRRWRPALTLLGALVTGVDRRRVLDVACGVEFVHTASLILDDLPSMDDGFERRGRPTLHRVFGEGVAVLAALALLNRGYELFAPLDEDQARHGAGAQLLREATTAIGVDGMIGGQAADLSGRDAAPLASRQRKTTSLVRLAVVAGAIAGGASDEDVQALATFGECLGGAYQIHDDLLDTSAGHVDASKTLGQDARHGRPSWTDGGDADAARTAAAAAFEEAREAVLARFGDCPESMLLIEAAGIIVDLVTGSLAPAREGR